MAWLKGKNQDEFLQFQRGRITRTPFPLGGFIYSTTINETAGLAVRTTEVYCGSDFAAARRAMQSATEGVNP